MFKNALMIVTLQASSRIEYFLANTTAERVKKAYPFSKYPGGVKNERYSFDNSKLVKNTLAINQSKPRILT